MKLPQLDLDLRRTVLHTPTALQNLILKNTKSVTVVTWSFGLTAAEELNELVKRGVKVQVVAGNIQLMGEPLSICRFPVISNKKCHCKIWIIDKKVYIGSTNLVSDTILNLMIRVKDKQETIIRELVQGLLTLTPFPTSTLILE